MIELPCDLNHHDHFALELEICTVTVSIAACLCQRAAAHYPSASDGEGTFALLAGNAN